MSYHSTSEPEGIVGQDGLGCPIVVLGGDAADEGLDVELGGAGLLARGIGALQAAVGLPQSGPLAQGRVLDVLKVLVEVRARTARNREESKLQFSSLQSVNNYIIIFCLKDQKMASSCIRLLTMSLLNL